MAGICRRNTPAITATIQLAEITHTTIVVIHHHMDSSPPSRLVGPRAYAALHTCGLALFSHLVAGVHRSVPFKAGDWVFEFYRVDDRPGHPDLV